jgi:hypothetical protein
MFEVEVEDLVASPCWACGGRSDCTAVLVPTESGQALAGLESLKSPRVLYRLCLRCVRRAERDPDFADSIHESLIADVAKELRP